MSLYVGYTAEDPMLVEPNFLEYGGYGIFCLGLYIALKGMSDDITVFSEKELSLLTNDKKLKRKIYSYKLVAITFTIFCFVFIPIRWLDWDWGSYGEEASNFAINCIPIIIASIFEIKQLYDRKEYYNLLQKHQKAINTSDIEPEEASEG